MNEHGDDYQADGHQACEEHHRFPRAVAIAMRSSPISRECGEHNAGAGLARPSSTEDGGCIKSR
jgi:nucleoside phosphorylase